MTSLIQYDRARAALAECQNVDEIFDFEAEMEHVKLYGRQINDRALIAQATEFQTRAQRRLGELLLEAERLGWIGRGRPKENVPTSEHFTLEEAGISRKESSLAQKLAELPEEEFERGVQDVKIKVIGGATTINGARSIMAARQQPSGSLDYFCTPPWATRALMQVVWPHIGSPAKMRVWEPACGEGHMAEVLAEYFPTVIASDLGHYKYGLEGVDFLNPSDSGDTDWIITNPPFDDKGEAFALRALDLARVGVAMFFRLQWLESVGRYERLFSQFPPRLIAQFAERVPLHEGRWEPEGTTATAYLWIVWLKSHRGPTEFFWIPPGQRKSLTHKDDVDRFTSSPIIRKTHKVTGDDLDIPPSLRRRA